MLDNTTVVMKRNAAAVRNFTEFPNNVRAAKMVSPNRDFSILLEMF